MKISKAVSGDLTIDELQVKKGESLCVFGANDSAVSVFVNWICHTGFDGTAEKFVLPENLGCVTFKDQQQVFEAELKKDQTDMIDRIDPGTPAIHFIHNAAVHRDLIDTLEMTRHLDKGYRQLSTGQARKLMLLAQLTKGRDFLIFENPFEGLDQRAMRNLDRVLSRVSDNGIGLILIVHNTCDIPNWCDKVAVIGKNKMEFSGRREAAVSFIETQQRTRTGSDFSSGSKVIPAQSPGKVPGRIEPLIRLRQGSAGYGGKTVFSNLTVNIGTGEHTLVTGSNGSGKSTLLQLVTGDHPACYTNDLEVFGKKRGSGESIWDIKKQMGIMSSDLHRNYIVPGNALHCVLSGLYDSIGLYKKPTPRQKSQAYDWLERIGLKDEATTPFRRLHFNTQRLVLIARALIKAPKLLILDEPTQGLDEQNRHALLNFLEDIASRQICTILFASHRTDEFRPFFKQHIRLG